MKLGEIEGKKILWALGTGAVLLLALWHYQGVKAGALESQDGFLTWWYGILAVLGLAAVFALGWLLLGKAKFKIETIFAAACLLLGLIYCFVLPPLSAPDEIRHYISAYKISSTMLGQPSTDENGRVYIRSQDLFIENSGGSQDGAETGQGLGLFLEEKTYREIEKRGLKGTGDNQTVLSGQTAVATTPLAYVAPGAGIALGRLLNLGGLGLLYLGRLFNLLMFTAVMWLAVKRMPFGKEILCAVGLLPMTLHLAASFSYDAMIICMSIYFAAICLDLAYSGKNVRIRDVVLLAAVMGIVGPCKMVYAVCMGFCLLIPVRKFGGLKQWAAAAAAVLFVYGAAMVLINLQTIQVYTGGTENYIGWAEEPGFTFSGLLHSPGKLIEMFYNTLVWQLQYYHLTMFGAYLGNIDQVLDVPYFIILFLTFALVVMVLKKPGDETIYIKGWKRAWIWFLFLACAGTTMFSMLVAWTPASSRVILGVQGRYFLPLLPIFLLTFKNEWLVLKKNYDRQLLFLIICSDVYAAVRLFSIVSMRI